MFSKIKSTTPSTKWLEQVGSAIALIDTKFNFVAASDQWYANFSFKKNDGKILDQNIFSIFPDLSHDFITRLEYAMDGLKDIQVICKANQLESIEQDTVWYLNPWKDGYGNTIGVVINLKEVSERKNLELSLSKTKHLLDQKSEIAKIGAWEYDVENEVLMWSDKVKKIHGLSSHYEPVLEHTFSFLKEGESYTTIRNAFEDAVKNAKPWNEVVQLITLNGQEKWVNSIGRPKFKDGRCTRILGTLQEVDKDKIKDSLRLIDQSFNYRALFEFAPTAMALCDFKSGKILEVNQKLLDDFGIDVGDIKGAFYGSYLSLMKSLRLNIAKSLLSNKKFEPVKTTLPKKLSLGSTVEITGTLIENGQRKAILVQLQKISEFSNHSIDSQGMNANCELEKLVHFNHMMAHNLKTHSTNISLLLGFLDKEVQKTERDKMMGLLNQSTEQLMGEIKILRQMVAIGENKGLKKVRLPLNDFILSAEQNLAGQIKKENAKIFNGVEEQLNVNVVPVYFESILNNILSNSLKFRQEDKNPIIIINVTENEREVILSIEDNGIGMDLEQHKDKIFALYRTINNTDSSGIGLYLAEYQMELMEGRIEVESKINVGTTIKLFIPKD